MKIKQKDVQVGDILLMSKGSRLTLVKVLNITKAGSLKISFKKANWEDRTTDYYSQQLEENIENHDKISYVPLTTRDPYYNQYFWLMFREDE